MRLALLLLLLDFAAGVLLLCAMVRKGGLRKVIYHNESDKDNLINILLICFYGALASLLTTSTLRFVG